MSKVDKKYCWDLTKVFENDKEYEKEVERAYKLIDKLISYKGKITENANSFYKFLSESDECDRLVEKIYVYSFLCYYGDGNDKVCKEKSLKATSLFNHYNESLSFVRSEILSCSYSKIEKFLEENKKLKKYKFNLEKLFRYKRYTLSEKEENIIALAGNSFGTPKETYNVLNNIDVKYGYINKNGERIEVTSSNYIDLISNPERKVRKSAFKCYYKFYSSHINTMSSLYLGSIKEKFFASKARGYESPLIMSLYADNLSDELYKSLIEVTNNNLYMLHDYLKLKAKKFGLKKLHMYDVYAGFDKEEEKKVKYDDAIGIILKALKPLGEDYKSAFMEFINNKCVDVYPKKGKRSGAYQWSAYDTAPYVSLNYVDNISSVSTFAHEMGHAVHSYYSNKNQDYIYADYPIFLAEIASTVNEILLNENLLKDAKDDEKVNYLCEFLEKVRGTIFRQVMFSEFESNCYDKYDKKIPLTKDELCDSYYKLNEKYFGEDVISDDEIKYEWARIPHFYTPFYVYKYATGLTCAIIIANKLISEEKGFREKYISFLSSGCSEYPLDTIKKLGIDLEDVNTLQLAFDYFYNKLEELKEILERK